MRSAPPAGSARSSPSSRSAPTSSPACAGREEGPALALICHVDTVPADPAEWTRDPWGGELGRRLRLGPRRARHEGPGGFGDRRLPGARRGGLAAGPRRHAAGGQRRRGDRRPQRRDVALRGAPGEGPVRHGPQRGRRARGLLRRQALLHPRGGREGRLPLPPAHPRRRRARLPAGGGRQRAAEAGPAAGAPPQPAAAGDHPRHRALPRASARRGPRRSRRGRWRGSATRTRCWRRSSRSRCSG